MSAGIAIAALPFYGDVAQVDVDEPYLLEVVAPIESETVDEAVRQAAGAALELITETKNDILGNVPPELDSLEKIGISINNDPDYYGTVDTALGKKADKAIRIAVAGLAQGGGDLSSDREIDVPAATQEQVNSGVDATTVVTPETLKGVLDPIRQRKIETEGLAQGGGDLTQDRTINVPASTNDDAIAGVDTDSAITPAALAVVIAHLFQTPGALQALLPTTLPSEPGLPWINGQVLAIS